MLEAFLRVAELSSDTYPVLRFTYDLSSRNEIHRWLLLVTEAIVLLSSDNTAPFLNRRAQYQGTRMFSILRLNTAEWISHNTDMSSSFVL